jgi:hypothetical protein
MYEVLRAVSDLRLFRSPPAPLPVLSAMTPVLTVDS